MMKIIHDIENPQGVNKFYPCKNFFFCFFFSGKVQRHLTLVPLWRQTGGLGMGEGGIFHFTPFYNFSVFLNVSLLLSLFLSGNQV